MSPAGTGIHPGSESGTCFPTNRPCRLPPEHEGTTMGAAGWWKCSSAYVSGLADLDSGFRRNDELGDRNDEARRGHLDAQASLEPSICAPQMAQGDAGNVPRLNRFLLPTRFRHYVVGTQRGPVGASQRSIQSKRWRQGEIGRRRSDSCKTSSDSTQRRCARRDETRY